MDYPKQLTVMYDGQPIGFVEITDQSQWKILGRFITNEHFAQNSELIDQARSWAKQFDDSHDSDSLDYLASDKYVEVIKRLTPRIAFPELPIPIEEFAVYHDFRVEITFGKAVM